jgi:hypothetical protein
MGWSHNVCFYSRLPMTLGLLQQTDFPLKRSNTLWAHCELLCLGPFSHRTVTSPLFGLTADGLGLFLSAIVW